MIAQSTAVCPVGNSTVTQKRESAKSAVIIDDKLSEKKTHDIAKVSPQESTAANQPGGIDVQLAASIRKAQPTWFYAWNLLRVSAEKPPTGKSDPNDVHAT